jgi:hypothetical protein
MSNVLFSDTPAANVRPWELDEFRTIDSDATSKAKGFAPSPTDAQLAAQALMLRTVNPEMAPRLTIKKYIPVEIARNEAATALFREMVRMVYGHDDSVLVGHHIGFEIGDDFTTENEIPSADTLITDHDVMVPIFGDNAIKVMQRLVSFPAATRDAELQRLFDARASLTLADIFPS